MFDVVRARSLHAVAHHGTISAAAAALHLTQSALSQQLARLEREVGQPLLVRRGRGVVLTDAGHLLVERTEEILTRITAAETALEAQRGRVTGRMAVAAFATATRAILPAALHHLRRHHPDLRLESREHDPTAALELLVRGDIDLAVIDEWDLARPPLPDGVDAAHLIDDVSDLALPTWHRLISEEGPIDLAECADESWISWEPGVRAHAWLTRELRERGCAFSVAHAASEHQTFLALVAAGLGIALVPRLGRGPVPDGVSLASLHRPPTRRVFAAWRSDTADRPAVQAALGALRAAVDGELSPRS